MSELASRAAFSTLEPRITAAIFGGGFFAYEALIEAARRITVPIQFLLPWDDEHVDRQSGLELLDAFASKDKTLHANPGDHRTIRWVGVDDEFLPPRPLTRCSMPARGGESWGGDDWAGA